MFARFLQLGSNSNERAQTKKDFFLMHSKVHLVVLRGILIHPTKATYNESAYH